MKKAYVVISLLSIITLAGCTLKAPQTPEVSTWDVMTGAESTGMVITWEDTTGMNIPTQQMEEVSEEFDAGEVPTLEGSENVSASTGIAKEVDTLIEKRADQPKDDGKLTEEDIDLMEEIIQKVQNLSK